MNGAYSSFSHYAGKRIHLGVCGSIAAYRAPDILRAWLKSGIGVSATLTESACAFITPLAFESLGAGPVYTTMFTHETTFGHLEPGQTAHALVIAPATATTMARIAHGLADDMLACQVLAFDGPVVIAPAMNTRMWENVSTQANVALLQERGMRIVTPDAGTLACGEVGAGRLARMEHIWIEGLRALTPQDMAGQKVMVTLGGTREPWDAVRYWSNGSTGTMGAALVLAAWLRGAEVHAVCGSCTVPWLPLDVVRHDVSSATEMFTVAQDLWPSMDVGLFCAAVADFAPRRYGEQKFKKAQATKGFSIEFTPNRDILQTLASQRKDGQKVLGFAAETTADLPTAVREKLQRKGADIIVGNDIAQEGAGFGTPTNAVYVADRFGKEEQWPLQSKSDVAWRLCSWLQEI